jgi:D-lactate dehydrogenase
LDETTAGLAQGHDVVCVFVNDDVNAAVVDKLADQGTTLFALRSAGCNNVAIDQIVKRKLTLIHVPAYSPHAVAEHALALLLTLNRKTHKVKETT